MNIALRRPPRLDEFLEWERHQELRYEFDGTQPVAMLSRGFYSGIEFADARLDGCSAPGGQHDFPTGE